MDWISHGAPQVDLVMRQFTPWARAVGDLLAHHDIAGFLANADDVRAMDDEDSEWGVTVRLHPDHQRPATPLRRHRHGRQCAPMMLVSDVLGPASVAFTSDVYAVVAEELAEAAAVAIAAFVPRRRRSDAVRAINVPSGPMDDLRWTVGVGVCHANPLARSGGSGI